MKTASTVRLSDSVAVLRGVGPKRAIALREVGIETVRDLLAFFPTRHEMYPASQAIDSLKTGQLATVVGQVTQCRIAKSRRRGAGHLHVRLMDATGEIDATFFNQAFLSNRLAVGDRCQVTGTVQHDGSGARLQPKYFEGAKDESASDAPERWVAVHAKTPGVARGTLQDLVSQALAAVGDGFDPLPPAMLKRRSLCSLSAAVRSVHQPVNGESLAAAENRLLFNSLLCHALLAMQGGMGATITDRRPVVSITAEVEAKLSDLFPFEMTTGQRTATELIGLQLQQTDGLRRLLIGDVGCGKTAVGTWAIGAVLASGHQVAVLAPTTTLARQWWSELRRFQPMGEEPALLMGGTPTSERALLLGRLKAGSARLVVGTHSLLSEDVAFASLGLMVVDEQHRFGVLQRLALTVRGRVPHVLAMSATPIPRSMALCLYGDDQPIEIRDRPPGHGSVTTHIYRRTIGHPFEWAGAAERAAQGVRFFVVFPSIESDDAALPSLLEHGRRLCRRFFNDVPVGFLHGGLSSSEKIEVLDQFREGEIRVLMTTTVIEVGVDVRDAQEIIIVGAERFGLAQLHQLRGRVGRGKQAGKCHLVVSNAAPVGELERLSILMESVSGFEIAAKDLRLRGPGDIMGLRQHGPALLPLTSISEDRLSEAVEDARQLTAADVDALELANELGFWSRSGHGLVEDLSGAI